MTDTELRDYIRRARAIAQPAGSMHAYWDVIHDAEAILSGKPSMLDRKVIEQQFVEMFGDTTHHSNLKD